MQPNENPFVAPAAADATTPTAEDQQLAMFSSPRATDILHPLRICTWVIGLFFAWAALNVFGFVSTMMRQEDVWPWTSLVNMSAGAIVYLVPGLLLIRCGWRIGTHLKQQTGGTLLAVLDAQRLFFQVLAVLALCWVVAQLIMMGLILSGTSPLI